MNIWRERNSRGSLLFAENKVKAGRNTLSLQLIMRNCVFIVLVFALFLSSCKKKNDPDISGTITINNELTLDPKLQTYVNYGFLFSQGKLVSNVGTPKPDVTIDNDGTLDNLILQAKINSRFSKYGEYKVSMFFWQEPEGSLSSIQVAFSRKLT